MEDAARTGIAFYAKPALILPRCELSAAYLGWVGLLSTALSLTSATAQPSSGGESITQIGRFWPHRIRLHRHSSHCMELHFPHSNGTMLLACCWASFDHIWNYIWSCPCYCQLAAATSLLPIRVEPVVEPARVEPVNTPTQLFEAMHPIFQYLIAGTRVGAYGVG